MGNHQWDVFKGRNLAQRTWRVRRGDRVPLDFAGTNKRHGTTYGYAQGCRCDPCTDAARDYARERKRRLREG